MLPLSVVCNQLRLTNQLLRKPSLFYVGFSLNIKTTTTSNIRTKLLLQLQNYPTATFKTVSYQTRPSTFLMKLVRRWTWPSTLLILKISTNVWLRLKISRLKPLVTRTLKRLPISVTKLPNTRKCKSKPSKTKICLSSPKNISKLLWNKKPIFLSVIWKKKNNHNFLVLPMILNHMLSDKMLQLIRLPKLSAVIVLDWVLQTAQLVASSS